MSTPTHSEERSLMHRWQKDIRMYQIAHLRTSARSSTAGRLLGLIVTIFSVIVGTSIFASLNSSNSQAILITVGVISLVATVISGVNSFLNYGERTERHQAAGIKYGSLRRRIDECLATMTDDQLKEEIKTIRSAVDQLEQESPVIPQKYIDEATRHISASSSKSITNRAYEPTEGGE